MAITAAEYLAQLQALLPPGAAWTREPDAELTLLLAGLAEELARIDGRAEVLIKQIDPRTSDELLGDWELVLGLPDPCAEAFETVQERRAAAYGKLVAGGGASRQFYIDLAGTLGYEITIKEFFRFTAGSRAGQAITNDDGWRHAWRVNAGETTYRHFKAGSSAGEPVRAWGDELLECAITKRKPAHTKVLFAYYLEEQHA